MKYLKKFENIQSTNSFTINDLIDYFDERYDFFDKTHNFLKLNILHKKISINGNYNKYSNITPEKLTYSPRSAPEFWIEVNVSKENKILIDIGINKNDTITLEEEISDKTKDILNEIKFKNTTGNYNL